MTVRSVPTPSYGQRMRELATERLLLRTFTSDDLEAVHAYAGDPEVCRFTDWGPNTPAQSRAFIDEMRAASALEQPDSMTWAVTAAGGVVGACSVTVTNHEHRRGAMGYVLARAYWGQGYATEAAAVVLRFAREDLGLERVEATCRPGNAASQRVLVKIGMQQEGLLRSHMLIRGRREDSLLFAVVG
jgi:ribosomal-protein-alanine N-acetyltransferase